MNVDNLTHFSQWDVVLKIAISYLLLFTEYCYSFFCLCASVWCTSDDIGEWIVTTYGW